MGSSSFLLGSSGECFGSFLACWADWFLPGRGALGAWHAAAELVRKDLIKPFCAEKRQLVEIPGRKRTGLAETSLRNSFVACVYTHGVCVGVIP